jgi:hypothetical protein
LNGLASRAHWVWAGLMAIGALGGLVFDPTPERPAVRRAGYRVLEGDFHAHTTFSDGSLTPFGLVRQAERRGLDVLGLTEHNTAIPAKIARVWSRLTGGPLVIVGEEITTARFHVIALGVSETVSTHRLAKDVIDEIHAKGGLAIAAHPTKTFWPALLPVRGELDGAEVVHPIAYSSRGPAWRWDDMVTFYEEAPRGPSGEPGLLAVGSSDYHWGSVLGLCRTLLFVDEPADHGAPTEQAVLAALRAKRTVVLAPDGRRFGDPALIAALEREPYEPRASDYAYRGEGVLDRVASTLGWIGALGLVMVGRVNKRRPREAPRDAAAGDR